MNLNFINRYCYLWIKLTFLCVFYFKIKLLNFLFQVREEELKWLLFPSLQEKTTGKITNYLFLKPQAKWYQQLTLNLERDRRLLGETNAKICFLAAAAKSLQLCPTPCDPIDGSPPGSAVPGILQTRTLEWVAISFSNAWKWKVKVKSLSRVRLLGIPWTAAYQAPPSMGFSGKSTGVGCPYLLHCFLETTPYKPVTWLS